MMLEKNVTRTDREVHQSTMLAALSISLSQVWTKQLASHLNRDGENYTKLRSTEQTGEKTVLLHLFCICFSFHGYLQAAVPAGPGPLLLAAPCIARMTTTWFRPRRRTYSTVHQHGIERRRIKQTDAPATCTRISNCLSGTEEQNKETEKEDETTLWTPSRHHGRRERQTELM